VADEFRQLSPQESKARLAAILTLVDTNKDDQIRHMEHLVSF
jgi:hypothetical protein